MPKAHRDVRLPVVLPGGGYVTAPATLRPHTGPPKPGSARAGHVDPLGGRLFNQSSHRVQLE